MSFLQETIDWNALLTQTARQTLGPLMDAISDYQPLTFAMKRNGMYEGLDALGERAEFDIMYELGGFGAYAGSDQLPQAQIDGITKAQYLWRQGASPITVTGIEKAQNMGRFQIRDLVRNRAKQAALGFMQGMVKAMWQGEAVNSNVSPNIETAYVDPTRGRSFVDPIPLLVKKDPTTGTVGQLDPSTRTWWQNITVDSTATSFVTLFKELRNFDLQMTENAGGGEGQLRLVYFCDRFFVEVYEATLRSQNRFTDRKMADFPFDHVLLFGKPLVWAPYVPNVTDLDTTQEQAKSVLYAIDSMSLGFKYFRRLGEPGKQKTDFRTPHDYDSSTAYYLVYCAQGTGNRRNHGVLYGIDGTIAS